MNLLFRFTLTFAVLAIGCASSTFDTAPEWRKQVSGSQQVILGVSFRNESVGYAVGTSGTILATTNGGKNWMQVPSGVTRFLRDVHFGSTTGTIVGEAGLILRTDGKTFTPQLSNTTEHLVNVHFYNDNIGMAVGQGGVILKTNNAGQTWTKQQSGTNVEVTAVKMLDANTAVAVGFGGKVLRTSNGGDTWNAISVAGLTSDLRSVDFNASNGVLVGIGGKIARSADSGNTWAVVQSGTTADLYTVEFSNNAVYAAGTATIIFSQDSGETWAKASHEEFSGDLYGLAFAGGKGWAAGQNGLILNKEN